MARRKSSRSSPSKEETPPTAGEDWRPEFEQAVGECFAESVCPPIPFENMITDVCFEIVEKVTGKPMTPRRLAALKEPEVERLCKAFSAYFETTAPSGAQIRRAVRVALGRWPIGSLGD